MRFLIVFAVVLLAFGCGDDTPSEDAPVDESESQPDMLTLSVSDTIGVLMGDSLQEFGSLADVEFDGEGNILALDAMKGRISIFTPSGEFVKFIGRHGAGPGEFQYPNCFAQLTDGSIVVADFSGATISQFNAQYEFVDRLSGFAVVPPMFPAAGPDGSYFAGSMGIDMSAEGGLPTGTSFIGLYRGGVEPEAILLSHPLDINIGDDGSVNVDNVDVLWDSDSHANLFWAISDDVTYSLHGVTADGDQIFTVEKDWQPVAKTEEEMQEEYYEEGLSRSAGGESTVNRGESTNQNPYHIAIDGIYIDDDDRIWVEQGYTHIPTFEVYSTEGVFLQHVTIPELAGISQLSYSFDNGMLAFDVGPTDFPKIYLLSDID